MAGKKRLNTLNAINPYHTVYTDRLVLQICPSGFMAQGLMNTLNALRDLTCKTDGWILCSDREIADYVRTSEERIREWMAELRSWEYIVRSCYGYGVDKYRLSAKAWERESQTPQEREAIAKRYKKVPDWRYRKKRAELKTPKTSQLGKGKQTEVRHSWKTYTNFKSLLMWFTKLGIHTVIGMERDMETNILTLSCKDMLFLLNPGDVLEWYKVGQSGWELGVWQKTVTDREPVRIKVEDDE